MYNPDTCLSVDSFASIFPLTGFGFETSWNIFSYGTASVWIIGGNEAFSDKSRNPDQRVKFLPTAVREYVKLMAICMSCLPRKGGHVKIDVLMAESVKQCHYCNFFLLPMIQPEGVILPESCSHSPIVFHCGRQDDQSSSFNLLGFLPSPLPICQGKTLKSWLIEQVNHLFLRQDQSLTSCCGLGSILDHYFFQNVSALEC